MNALRLADLIPDILARLVESNPVPRHSVSIGEWAPEIGRCHVNVISWLAVHENDRSARGFLVQSVDHMRIIMPHSVVELQNGQLIDITPATTAAPPFVRFYGQDDDFLVLAEENGQRWFNTGTGVLM